MNKMERLSHVVMDFIFAKIHLMFLDIILLATVGTAKYKEAEKLTRIIVVAKLLHQKLISALR